MPESKTEKEFRVCCSWTVTGEYLIKAETLGEAMELAEDEPSLPKHPEYVEGSFEVYEEYTMQLNGRDTQ